ncbi:MAG TPA: DUF3618 domain-containing protein [Microvirga sp.]|jgi:hypothetical protein|nr:DUF3618 domain-containing protein [Microvirga sp.]
MAQSINDLERDIAESRARLDNTIDRIQDKLSVSGIVDDVLGQMRRNRYASTYDSALEVIRRNPVPVMLIAAGIGWLLHRSTREQRVTPEVAFRPYDDAEMPVVTRGQPRVYPAAPAALDPLPDTFGTGHNPAAADVTLDPLGPRPDPVAPLTATGLGSRV